MAWSRTASSPAVQRARLVLPAAEGVSDAVIAGQLGLSRSTVLPGGHGSSPSVWRDWRNARPGTAPAESPTRRCGAWRSGRGLPQPGSMASCGPNAWCPIG
ncbi:MAG: helix-turn-helix domain-containing protein [Chloroflexi bacterium]|nr:helix-turn-helix domain-containing protein [Chloroflexota bacterium]